MNNKTFTLNLTDREIRVIIMALETEKNIEAKALRPISEIIELRNKLRDAK